MSLRQRWSECLTTLRARRFSASSSSRYVKGSCALPQRQRQSDQREDETKNRNECFCVESASSCQSPSSCRNRVVFLLSVCAESFSCLEGEEGTSERRGRDEWEQEGCKVTVVYILPGWSVWTAWTGCIYALMSHTDTGDYLLRSLYLCLLLHLSKCFLVCCAEQTLLLVASYRGGGRVLGLFLSRLGFCLFVCPGGSFLLFAGCQSLIFFRLSRLSLSSICSVPDLFAFEWNWLMLPAVRAVFSRVVEALK